MTYRSDDLKSLTIAQQLLGNGSVKLGKKSPKLFDKWLRQEWIEVTTNNRFRNTYELTPSGKECLEAYIVQHFGSDWVKQLFEQPNNTAQMISDKLLQPLPDLIHPRVVNAIWGAHSKQQAEAPEAIRKEGLEIIQLRTNTPLSFHFSHRIILSHEEMEFANAIILNERMLQKLQRVESHSPLHIVTIENTGSWQHFPLPDGVIALFIPGNNQTLLKKFFEFFPDAHWGHFGDLDQSGIDIALSIANSLNKKPKLFIPSFWIDYLLVKQLTIEDSKTKKSWKKVQVKSLQDHPIIVQLQTNNSWLEQEVIMLDKRLKDAVIEWIKE